MAELDTPVGLIAIVLPGDGCVEVGVQDPRGGEVKVRTQDGGLVVVSGGREVASGGKVDFNGIDEMSVGGYAIIVPHGDLGDVLGKVRIMAEATGTPHNIQDAVDVTGLVFYEAREEIIANFMAVTGLPLSTAASRLKQNRFNLDLALTYYYEYGEGSGNMIVHESERTLPPPRVRKEKRRRSPPPHHLTLRTVARRIAADHVKAKSLPNVKHVGLSGNSLSSWVAHLAFPGTLFQRDLDELSHSTHIPNRLVISLTFPHTYPADPPLATVVEPRIKHQSAPVSFSGKIVAHSLTPAGWSAASHSLPAVINEIHTAFQQAEVCRQTCLIKGYSPDGLERVDTSDWLTENSFDAQYVVSTPDTAFGVVCSDTFDRIVLPPAAANVLYGGKLTLPLIFEISTSKGRRRHCGIDKEGFQASVPNTDVVLPTWVAEDLFVKPGDSVRVRCVSVPPVQFVKLQPHSKEFYADAAQCPSPAEALQRGLRGMAALTQDTTVPIVLDTNLGPKLHHFEVKTIKPKGAARLITEDPDEEIEFKVDFEAAPDHLEEEDRLLNEEKLKAKHEKERIRAEKAAAKAERKYLKHIEELKNVPIEEGDICLQLRLPDGEVLKCSLAAGADIKILSIIVCMSKWAGQHRLVPHNIKIMNSYPRTEVQATCVDKGMHKQTYIVSQSNEEGLERDDTATSTLSTMRANTDCDMPDYTTETLGNTLLELRLQYYTKEGLDRRAALHRVDMTPDPPAAICLVCEPHADNVVLSTNEVVPVVGKEVDVWRVTKFGKEDGVPKQHLVEVTEQGLTALVLGSLGNADEYDGGEKVGYGIQALCEAAAQETTPPPPVHRDAFESLFSGSSSEASDDSFESSSSEGLFASPPPHPPPPSARQEDIDMIKAILPHVDTDVIRTALMGATSVDHAIARLMP